MPGNNCLCNHNCSHKTVYVESEFSAFCQKEAFKQYVRNAINSELFWRDLFDKYRIESRIDTHLSDKVPKLVRDNMTYTLPGLVAKQLSEQLPTFLNQNADMQRILSEHSQRLNTSLEETARKHLERIVNEDHYHEVNQAFFNAIDARADEKIRVIGQNGRDAIIQMQRECNQSLQRFTEQVGKLDSYERRTKEVETKCSDLQNRTSNMMWGWGITTLLLGGAIGFLLSRH